MNTWKITFLLLACLISITSYTKESHFVEAKSISKYYFQLENTTVVPLLVELRLSKSEESEFFILNASHTKSYAFKDLERDAYLKVSYPFELRKLFEESVQFDQSTRELWEQAREKITGIIIDEKWREGEESRDRIVDDIGKEIMNRAINNWLGVDNRKEIEELKKLITESAYISAVWDAKESDEYQREFGERDLRKEARSWRFFKGGLSGSLNVDLSFPMYHNNLGKAWRYHLPFKGHSLSASVMIVPDWTWWNAGRTPYVFSRLFAFAEYQSDYYKLSNRETFYVSSDFVKNEDAGYFPIISKNGSQLRIGHYGAGSFLRTMFYNTFYIDLGVGYRFQQWGETGFKSEDNEGNTIIHLEEDRQLSETYFSDIIESSQIDLNNINHYFGVIRGHIIFGGRNGSYGKRSSLWSLNFYGRIYRQFVFANDVFSFYELNEDEDSPIPEFTPVQIVDKPYNWRFSFTIGITYTF
ncbi:MAG: hypothetical protein ACI8ZM_004432 [Crocinitomix sp.]|jgi:hypothetical protein